MSKISKALHMFVADQWIRGNAKTPRVSRAACSYWFPNGVTEVTVGLKSEYFHGLTPSEVTAMLKGAGWYGKEVKEAQKVLQGATPEQVSVRRSTAFPNEIHVNAQEIYKWNRSKYLKYKGGNSPALFLLAAYRAHQEAEKLIRTAVEQRTFVDRYGAPAQIPSRGHAKSDLSNAQAEAAIKRDQKLNTLLLHRDLANALEAVNRVLHWGCNERQPPYPETGWKDVPLDKYKQALLRHQSEWLKDPSSLDDESGKLHLAHMATNALILLQRWPEEGKSGSADH